MIKMKSLLWLVAVNPNSDIIYLTIFFSDTVYTIMLCTNLGFIDFFIFYVLGFCLYRSLCGLIRFSTVTWMICQLSIPFFDLTKVHKGPKLVNVNLVIFELKHQISEFVLVTWFFQELKPFYCFLVKC